MCKSRTLPISIRQDASLTTTTQAPFWATGHAAPAFRRRLVGSPGARIGPKRRIDGRFGEQSDIAQLDQHRRRRHSVEPLQPDQRMIGDPANSDVPPAGRPILMARLIAKPPLCQTSIMNGATNICRTHTRIAHRTSACRQGKRAMGKRTSFWATHGRPFSYGAGDGIGPHGLPFKSDRRCRRSTFRQ